MQGKSMRYLHANDAELRRRLAELLLGKELAERAYAPLTESAHDF